VGSSRKLSSGAYQRVALARAKGIIQSARAGPTTANPHPYNVGLIEAIVQSVRVAGRTTQVLISRHTCQAKCLADRVAMLLEGDVVEVGASGQIFDAPKDPRTAAFIRGDMVY
jgi:tungstate transport system ATP-binding protein